MKLELHQLDYRYEKLRVLGKARQVKMISSLSEHGQQTPVLVVNSDTDRPILIDGYLRVSALRQMGQDLVQAVSLDLSEEEALVFCHRQERNQNKSALEDGWLVKELVDCFGFGLEAVGIQLGRSKSWVSRRIGLVKDLPDVVQSAVRTGNICAWAAAKYLLPLARANTADCEQLVKGVGRKRLSSRQWGELYVAWKLADNNERQKIIEHPHLYLKAEAEICRKETAPSSREEELLKNMDVLVAVCHRLRRGLCAARAELEQRVFLHRIKKGWKQFCLGFERLEEQMEESLNVGHRHQNRNFAFEDSGPRDPDHSQNVGSLPELGQAGVVERSG